MISSEKRGLENATNALQNKDREQLRLTWVGARKILLKDNLSLRNSQSRLTEIRRQRKSQWREWLPRPSLYLGLQSSLRNLGDVEFNDIAKTFYAPLSIPNPVTQRARAYSYALTEIQAEDSHEMTRRRMIVSLYATFMDWERMNNDFNFGDRGETLENEVNRLMGQMEQKLYDRERVGRFWTHIGRMLNRPGVNIVPITKTAPNIDYRERLAQLEPGRNYAKIAYRLSSYEIVGSLLRAKGIKIAQWPQSRVNAGFPAIYDSNRGGDEWFKEPDQISLFGSISKSFDVTGYRAASIKNAEDQVEFIRHQLKLRMDAEDREWRRLKERYHSVLVREELLEGRLLRALQMEEGDVARNWDNVKSLFQQLQNTRRVKLGLDMELWVWDDAAWE